MTRKARFPALLAVALSLLLPARARAAQGTQSAKDAQSMVVAQAQGGGQAPAASAAPGDKTAAMSSGVLKIRDPFRRPGLKYSAVPRTVLELYSVEQMKLVGVITGPDQMKAMILAPDGKTHIATEGSKIGTRDGVVAKITGNGILVKEKFVNVLGQEELHDYPMLLPPEEGR